MKKQLFITAILGLVLIVAACSGPKPAESLPTQDFVVFKSASCGCCGIYSQYMEKQGFNVRVQNVDTIDQMKDQFGVPAQIRSCHTSQVGGYFVEGHVPMEAIEKLLTEKPDIAGIGMPGMPQGSPGMPGAKSGTWTIYAVDHDGGVSEFMEL